VQARAVPERWDGAASEGGERFRPLVLDVLEIDARLQAALDDPDTQAG
jgi:hypothetical protein